MNDLLGVELNPFMVLWLGAGLIAVVVVRGLWRSWQEHRLATPRQQRRAPGDGAVPLSPSEQTLIDFEVPAIAEAEAHVQVALEDEPMSDVDDFVESTRPRKGRRLNIPGTRTEPTVPLKDRARVEPQSGQGAEPAAPEAEVDDVLVIWVFAGFRASLNGETLADVLQSHQLVYGGEVFSKFDPNSGRELFTVANGVAPGTFDLSAGYDWQTPCVALIMRMSTTPEPTTAFEDMLQVATAIETSQEGELKDQDMGDMSQQTIEHYRQRIRDFKRTALKT